MGHYRRPHARWLVVWALLGLLSTTALAGPPAPRGTPSVTDTTLPYTAYLPLTSQLSPPPSIFGIEVSRLTPDRAADKVVALNAPWVRRNGLLWRDVEPVEGGGYNWSAPNVQALEQEMLYAREHGLKLILVIRGSPRWATAPIPSDCAPVNPAKYGSYANFVAAAVARYSRPPYNVEFWELGNEPDAPQSGDAVYGCWGDPNDPYYGGRAYGTLLNTVYPRIKAVNPSAQVLNGSLTLLRPYNPQTGADRMSRFVEGMFVAGAGASFDILGYHAYCYYQGNGNPDGLDNRNLPCTTDWKVGYLRELMSRYGVAQKPLLNTETALLCFVPGADCQQAQASAVGRLYARGMRDRLIGLTWYVFDSDSFRNSALVEPSNPAQPRPAYVAYQHAATMLGSSVYAGPLEGQPPGVEGYRFRNGAITTIVFWSNTPQTATISVPAGSVPICSNRDGAPLACSSVGGSLSLPAGVGPTYVLLR